MAAITADFEKGVNGNAITTAAGEASLTGFNAVTATVPVYDSTRVAHGTLAATLNVIAGAGNCLWSTAFGTQTEHWGRMYLYLTAAPIGNFEFLVFQNGGSRAWRLYLIASNRHIYIYNAANSFQDELVHAVPTGQWSRLEWHAVQSATVGTVELNFYDSADSTTVSATVLTAAFNNAAQATQMQWGSPLTATTVNLGFDQLVATATAYPGPYPVNTTAPTVSGSATVGSLLTATNGTWNSGATFTITYQWTRAGVNIGGATASTYTTVAGDVTHAVGCTVTATGVQATNESAAQASSNTITVTAAPSASKQDGIRWHGHSHANT